MYKSKKGLSDIVTTVLIILLAIAAVIIVWAFIRNLIQNTGRGLTTDCVKLELEPTGCHISTTDADITFLWASGDISGSLTDVRLIVEDSNGERDIKSASTSTAPVYGQIPGAVLETGKGTVDFGNVNPSLDLKASIAGVISGADGQTVTCKETTPIPCS